MELTVAIAHQQHSMVDEPRAAEGPEWVSDTMVIELRRKQEVGGQLRGEVGEVQTKDGAGVERPGPHLHAKGVDGN